MANASKTHIGKGAKGKGAGVGAMTTLPDGVLEENMVLTNRDKSQHPQDRGLDSRAVRNEQHQDNAHNRRQEIDDDGPAQEPGEQPRQGK